MDGNKIIQYFKSGEDAKAIALLYEYFPIVESYVKKNGGSSSDAQDVFQEGLILLYKKLFKPNFEFTSKAETFLFGICKNLWFGELKMRNANHKGEWVDDLLLVEEVKNHLEEEKKYAVIDTVLQALGKSCLQILELFYYKGKSMLEIADLMAYNNVNTVKTQKYKCLERAKKMAQIEFNPSKNRVS